MRKLPILLLLVCFTACNHPVRADYAPFEKYEGMVRAAVAEMQLPSCYRYLPLLLTDCDSLYVGDYASGMWALSVPVAQHYGLSDTDSEDERFSAERATFAATHYLKDLRDYFQGSDSLVLRQYVKVEPMLRMSADSILWALQKIEAEYEGGRRESSFLPPLKQAREEMARKLLLQEELKRRAAAKIASKAKAAPTYIYYKVKRGDVLGKIAQRNHCTVKQLKQWNNLRSDNIREGQRLKILKR